jgi:zinc/manganese transport system permease protein
VTQAIFLGLVVLNLVGGFLALGTMLAVGILMLPAIAARFWASSVPIMIAVAIAIGILAEYVGLLLSYDLSLPTGPTIILAGGGFCILSFLFGVEDGLIPRLLPHRKQKLEPA